MKAQFIVKNSYNLPEDLTFMKEVEKPVLDKAGNSILDEQGNPITETVKELAGGFTLIESPSEDRKYDIEAGEGVIKEMRSDAKKFVWIEDVV